MMLPVSASHFSTVLCPMPKENLSFWQNYTLRKHHMQTVWKIHYWRIKYCARTFV